MKKANIIMVTMVLLLVLCSCTRSPEPDSSEASKSETTESEIARSESVSAETSGGWEMIPNEAVKLPEDAQNAFEKTRSKLNDGEYIPVSLLATQQVAGTNYCILCQVNPKESNTESKWSLVYIYADLQGNTEIMNIYDLYIAKHSSP